MRLLSSSERLITNDNWLDMVDRKRALVREDFSQIKYTWADDWQQLKL